MNDRGISYSGNKKLSSVTGEEEVFDTPIQSITGEDVGEVAGFNLIKRRKEQMSLVQSKLKVVHPRMQYLNSLVLLFLVKKLPQLLLKDLKSTISSSKEAQQSLETLL